VSDVASTAHFYQKFFGAKQIKFKNRSDALVTEKSFIFFNTVDSTPSTNEGSSLWHIGWSGVNGPEEYNWRVKEGIEVHSPVTALGNDHWMYFWGPNNEVVEVFTANKNNNFEHIHLLATDVDKTMEWFETYLGLAPVNSVSQPWQNGLFKWNHLWVGNINIYVFGKPVEKREWYPENFKSTQGTAIDHIGFSFKNISSVYEKMKGLEIVKEIETDLTYEVKSFFVNGPDGLLIEILEDHTHPDDIGTN